MTYQVSPSSRGTGIGSLSVLASPALAADRPGAVRERRTKRIRPTPARNRYA